MKKQMKQVAAATLAALCFGAVAIPTVASAAEITVTNTSQDIDFSKTTLTAYKIFGINAIGDGMIQVDGATVSSDVATVFQTQIAAALAANGSAPLKAITADEIGSSDAAKQASLATKIGDYLNYIQNNNTAVMVLARALAGKGTEVTAEWSITGDTATLSGVEVGYYLVTGVMDDGTEIVNSSVMLKAANEKAAITLKADKPTIDKNIVENGDLVDANTAGVGQTVEYQLDSKVPSHTYYANYTLTMTDTISDGIDFNQDSVVVKVGTQTLTKGEDYTVVFTSTDDDAHIEQMVIDFVNVKGLTIGDAIVVNYDATVNEDAIVDPEKGNANAVKLTYSNDPNWDTDGDGIPDDEDEHPDTPDTPPTNPETPPTEETPPVEVITYLTEIKIHKVDETGAAMPDVQFTLTGQTHNVTYYIKGENGEFTVSTQGFDGATAGGVKVTTDEDGNIVFSGLTADTYTVVESETPAGFIKADDLVIIIGADFGQNQASSTKAPAWSYDDSNDATNNASNEFTIINKRGTTLPETGGIGTTIFTVVGLTLMATAAGAFIIKRKVTAQ